MRARFLAVLALTLLGACASVSDVQRAKTEGNRVLVCVSNDASSMGDLIVRSRYGRSHTVMGGKIQCRPVGRGHEAVEFGFETLGGGAWGPGRGYATMRTRPGECWWVRFNSPSGQALPYEFVPCSWMRAKDYDRVMR